MDTRTRQQVVKTALLAFGQLTPTEHQETVLVSRAVDAMDNLRRYLLDQIAQESEPPPSGEGG